MQIPLVVVTERGGTPDPILERAAKVVEILRAGEDWMEVWAVVCRIIVERPDALKRTAVAQDRGR